MTSTQKDSLNVNSIDVDIININLYTLIQMIQRNEVSLDLDSQRISDNWSNVKKSKLIEYILLGLPLPSFYFSEDKYSNKLVVAEGLQCLYAINDFVIRKTLKLERLQLLPYLEGKGYDDLNPSEIRKIKSLKVTINILKKTTPNDLKLIIFNNYHSWQ